MTPVIIIVCALVFALALVGMFFYYRKKLSEQDEEMKSLATKCARQTSTTKIEAIVDDIPKIQILSSTTTNLNTMVNDLNTKLKAMITEQEQFKKDIAKLGELIEKIKMPPPVKMPIHTPIPTHNIPIGTSHGAPTGYMPTHAPIGNGFAPIRVAGAPERGNKINFAEDVTQADKDLAKTIIVKE